MNHELVEPITIDPRIFLRIINRAIELVSNPKKWTKKTYARNYLDQSVAPMSPEAVCFCLYGAIERSIGELALPGVIHSRVTSTVLDFVYSQITGKITNFNDFETTTHADILAVLNKARAELRNVKS